MTAKPPPVPQENLSQKGPGDTGKVKTDTSLHGVQNAPDDSKQGQPGNTTINTTPQLKVQDR